MIEEIISLGDVILSDIKTEGDFLATLINPIKKEQKGKKTHVAKINFSTKNKDLQIDITEEVKDTTAYEYVFIGKADGANSPQWFASTNNLSYILTETIFNLSKQNIPEISEKCKMILQKYFVDIRNYLIEKGLELPKNVDSKYTYFLDIDNISLNGKKLCENNLEAIYKSILENIKVGKIKENKPLKHLREQLSSEVGKNIAKMFDLKPEQIALYVICIDDEPITSNENYRNALISYKQSFNKKADGTKKTSKKAKEVRKSANICYICLSQDDLSDSGISKASIKLFTTNQVIFASNLDTKLYGKNMVLCSECLKKLLAGEVFLKGNLKTSLGSFDVYALPHFVHSNVRLEKDWLQDLSKSVLNSFNTAWNYNSLEDFKNKVKNLLDLFDENHYFLLNLVFYKDVNAGTKILRFIPDINPSIFDSIFKASQKTEELFNKLIGNNPKFKMSLQTIFYSIPLKTSQKTGNTENKKILQVYDAVFSQRIFPKKILISYFVESIKILHLGQSGYNLSNLSKQELSFPIINMVFLLKFLELLGCIEEGSSMDVNQLNLSDDIKRFIDEMKYDEQKTALFLLGVLIGEIGNKQYQGKKDSDNQKPILNKLNFNGIDKPKLIRLTKDIFNKLKQEKILAYTELTFASMKSLLDKNIDNWKLDKYETLFYILSGYAYKTQKAILSASNAQETA